MAIAEAWGSETVQVSGPTDRELVAALRRVASAQAHLALAEREAQLDDRGGLDESIEEKYQEVVWARAGALAAPRSRQVAAAVEVAESRLEAVLSLRGFATLTEYRWHRQTPAWCVHLELARQEYAAATRAWRDLQSAMAPTVILDLTGDEPRVIP